VCVWWVMVCTALCTSRAEFIFLVVLVLGAMNHDEDEVIIVGKKRSPIWESLCCHVIDLKKEQLPLANIAK
jgi:hypothetical protein